MANLDFRKIINDFCSFYGIPLKNLTFSFNNKIPIAQIEGKNEPLQGLRNIVSHVSKPNDLESNAIQDHWVEYALTHLDLDSSTATDVLRDLNEYMVDKVYFVGNSLGPVDILMYYLLYNVLLKLTFQEKEKYINTSRWVNNVQHNNNARLWRSVIPFSRSCLYL